MVTRQDSVAPGRMGSVEYRVLGPLSVVVDGHPVRLGGPRQQMVLAILLARAGETVSQDALLESAWAGRPPESGRSVLHTYVSALRKELGAKSIERLGDGYRISLDSTRLDARDFEAMVAEARASLHERPAAAVTLLRQALAMWYGNPYGGLDDNPLLAVEVSRLRELRLVAVESRIEAELAEGNHAGVIGDLETLVREHPLRERFRAQHLLALYRCGRQAEALRAYQQARLYLAEELGIDPSSELRDLEQRILDQDPTLLCQGPAERSSLPAHDEVGRLPQPGGRMVRGYELRDPVGEGDFGVVHRAFQPSVSREVAIKVIRPEYADQPAFVERFEREAQIVAQLEHPHIVPLFDFWREPGGAYLVMPYLRGGSLAGALRRGGWNLGAALHLMEQVAGALAHAHRRGVVHRDVKPANVLLDEEGNAYLSDFGIATRLTDDATTPLSTSLAFVSPEEVRGQPLTARSDIFSLGALAFQLLTGTVPGSRPLPSLAAVRPGLSEGLEEVLDRATDDNPANRFEKVEDFMRAFRQAVGADVVAVAEATGPIPAPEPARNPYKGLRAFTESDALDFHGREALVDELLQAVAEHNVVAVVGPSGSGKSSVVRAGLIPALRAGALPGSRRWLTTDMYPGSYPFEELEAALLRVAVDRPPGLLTDLLAPNGMLRVTKLVLPGDDSTLVLIVDQFEELFSAVASEAVRRLFLDNLVTVARDERSRVRVVLTMRADFFNRPLEYAEFAEVMGRGTVTVGPPTRDGLAQAIASPARSVGVDLEPGLVGRLVADVENQPGGLPLLQYALTELFATRNGAALTIAEYERTGGVLGALGQRAEELYQGLPEAGREAARQLFLRLVTVDEAVADTRRRARQAELRGLDIDHTALDRAIAEYGSFRLLAFDRDPVTRGPTIEVAHEALLREWDRLSGWIDERRDELILQRRIGLAAQEWEASDRDPSFLLHGARLEQAEWWRETADLALTAGEVEYIEAGCARRAAEEVATKRRRRRLVAALCAGLVVLGAATTVALAQRGVAQREGRDARARELAGESLLAIDEDPQLALHLALAATDLSRAAGEPPLPEVVTALHEAVGASRLEAQFSEGLEDVVADPGGEWYATRTASGAGVFDLTGTMIATLSGPANAQAAFVAAAPDGSMVAVSYTVRGDSDAAAVLFDPDTGAEMLRFEAPVPGTYGDLDFSPDGSLVLAGVSPMLETSVFEQVVIWDATTGETVRSFQPAPQFGSVHFATDDEVVILEWQPNRVRFFTRTGEETRSPIDVAESPLATLHPSPDRRLAVLQGDFLTGVTVLDLDRGEVILEVPGERGYTIAWSPDGTTIVQAGNQPYVHVFDLASGERTMMLPTGKSVTGAALLPGDRLLTVGYEPGTALWDVSDAGPRDVGAVTTETGVSFGFEFSPDGSQIASFTRPGGFEVVSLAGDESSVTLGDQAHEYNTTGVRTVGPGFSLVGSFGEDGSGAIQRLPSLELVRQLDPCTSAVAFSRDDSLAVVTGWSCTDPPPAGATAAVMDIATGTTRFELPLRWVGSAAFAAPEGGGGLLAVRGDGWNGNAVGFFDVATGGELGTFTGMQIPLLLSTSPDGRYVVVGSQEGRVVTFDAAALAARSTIETAVVFDVVAHTGPTPWPAVSDGGLVATSGFDGLVRLWDMASGEMVVELHKGAGDVFPVLEFSPDGEYLYYADSADLIRRFPVDSERLVALAQSRLVRDLTADECRRYFPQEECPGSG